MKTSVIREVLEEIRVDLRFGNGILPPETDICARILARLNQIRRQDLCRVINGTGVVLHTNLGRAPMAKEAADAASDAAGGYSNLEYDLNTGSRGDRCCSAERRLQKLTGAESALIVNNNAAAVLLILSALGAGHEAVISRGELVEIGGSFRVPEIMESCGCILREVGTTNKTHLTD
ncbi:MAG: L-seryl-tRNA(Sec) selenium transferase, partial [Eubacteriales bacterium]|nr:L-seryl-tRNA(Sec) selenium transferase [Eubacteriales bacterium]